MNYETPRSTARGMVRTLSRQEELPLLRDHLLRLDLESRHDRFHGFMDDGFIKRYAAKCAEDGTIIIAYLENGVVRGAAELHPPDQSPGSQPEIAFSVEAQLRRQGVQFRQDDNAFLSVSDPQALQAAADRLSAPIIRKQLEYWTSVVGPQFSKQERAAISLRREYSLNQLELCRNLVFKRHSPFITSSSGRVN